MSELHLLCAGAAKGVVEALAPQLVAKDTRLHAQFGAVGAMRDKLERGEPCDVVVLSSAILAELAREGRVMAASVAPLGRVRTAIAVRSDDTLPDVASSDSLRTVLAAADAIYVPDTERSTAGTHFLNVLRTLGLEGELRARLRRHPNGATAMAALARAPEPRPIGCTQATEILYTPGVRLVAALPAGLGLATLYAVGVTVAARETPAAHELANLLCGPETGPIRRAAGFED